LARRREYAMPQMLAAAKAGGNVGRTEDFPHVDSRVSVAPGAQRSRFRPEPRQAGRA
jgi:hypothetical protein